MSNSERVNRWQNDIRWIRPIPATLLNKTASTPFFTLNKEYKYCYIFLSNRRVSIKQLRREKIHFSFKH